MHAVSQYVLKQTITYQQLILCHINTKTISIYLHTHIYDAMNMSKKQPTPYTFS